MAVKEITMKEAARIAQQQANKISAANPADIKVPDGYVYTMPGSSPSASGTREISTPGAPITEPPTYSLPVDYPKSTHAGAGYFAPGSAPVATKKGQQAAQAELAAVYQQAVDAAREKQNVQTRNGENYYAPGYAENIGVQVDDTDYAQAVANMYIGQSNQYGAPVAAENMQAKADMLNKMLAYDETQRKEDAGYNPHADVGNSNPYKYSPEYKKAMDAGKMPVAKESISHEARAHLGAQHAATQAAKALITYKQFESSEQLNNAINTHKAAIRQAERYARKNGISAQEAWAEVKAFYGDDVANTYDAAKAYANQLKEVQPEITPALNQKEATETKKQMEHEAGVDRFVEGGAQSVRNAGRVDADRAQAAQTVLDAYNDYVHSAEYAHGGGSKEFLEAEAAKYGLPANINELKEIADKDTANSGIAPKHYDGGAKDAAELWLKMSSEEKAAYEYFAARSHDKARQYIAAVETDINRREAENELAEAKAEAFKADRQGWWQGFSNWAGASLKETASNLSLENVLQTTNQAIENMLTGDYNTLDLNDKNFRANAQAQVAAEQFMKGREGIEGFVSELAMTLFQQGGTTASLLINPAVGAYYIASTSAGAAAYEALKDNAKPGEALALALGAAAAEYVSEKMPFDRMFGGGRMADMLTSKNARQQMAAIGRTLFGQAATEAGEEVLSNVLNTMLDITVRGKNSTVGKQYQALLNSGYSERSALLSVLTDYFNNDMVKTAAISALTGGLMGMSNTARMAFQAQGVRDIAFNQNLTQRQKISALAGLQQQYEVQAQDAGITAAQAESAQQNAKAIGALIADIEKNSQAYGNDAEADAALEDAFEAAADAQAVNDWVQEVQALAEEAAANAADAQVRAEAAQAQLDMREDLTNEQREVLEKVAMAEAETPAVVPPELLARAKKAQEQKAKGRKLTGAQAQAIEEYERYKAQATATIPDADFGGKESRMINLMGLNIIAHDSATPAQKGAIERRTQAARELLYTARQLQAAGTREANAQAKMLSGAAKQILEEARSLPGAADANSYMSENAKYNEVVRRLEGMVSGAESNRAKAEFFADMAMAAREQGMTVEEKAATDLANRYAGAKSEREKSGKFRYTGDTNVNTGESQPRIEFPDNRVGKKSGLVQDTYAKQLTHSVAEKLDSLGSLLGVEIRVSDKMGDVDGMYVDGTIWLNLKGSEPVNTVLTHEVVHRMKESSPDMYGKMEEFVEQNVSQGVREIIEKVLLDSGYTQEQIREETVARAFGYMLGDTDVLNKFVKDERSAAQKILDFIKDIGKKIKNTQSKEQSRNAALGKGIYTELFASVNQMEELFTKAILNADPSVSNNTGLPKVASEATATRQISKLKRQNAYLAAQARKTTTPTADIKETIGAAKKYKADFKSRADEIEISKAVETLWNMALRGKDAKGEEVTLSSMLKYAQKNIADVVMAKANTKTEAGRTLDKIQEELRGKTIAVPDGIKTALDVQNIRGITMNAYGMPITSVYNTLNAIAPEVFSKDIVGDDMQAQLLAIQSGMEYLHDNARLTEKQLQDIGHTLAQQAVDDAFNANSRVTLKDQMDAEMQRSARDAQKAQRRVLQYEREKHEKLAQSIVKSGQELLQYEREKGEKLVKATVKSGQELVQYEREKYEKLAKSIVAEGQRLLQYEREKYEKLLKASVKSGQELVQYEREKGEKLAKSIVAEGQRLLQYEREKGEKLVNATAKEGQRLLQYEREKYEKLAKSIVKSGQELVQYEREKYEKLLKAATAEGQRLVKYEREKGEKLLRATVREGQRLVKYEAQKGQILAMEMQRAENKAYEELQKRHEELRERIDNAAERKEQSMIRTQLLRNLKRLEQLSKKSTAEEQATIREVLDGIYTKGLSYTQRTREKLTTLEAQYRAALDAVRDMSAVAKATAEANGAAYSKDIEEKISALYQTQIKDLSKEDVENLIKVTMELDHKIREGHKLKGKQKAQTLHEATEYAAKQLSTAKKVKVNGREGKLLNNMDPEAFFLRAADYDRESPMYQAYKNIVNGTYTRDNYIREAYEGISGFTGDKAYMQTVSGKKARRFEVEGTDAEGNRVKVSVTAGMLMEMYMSSFNEDNMRHAEGEGFTLPDLDMLYNEKKAANAYANSKPLRFTTMELRRYADKYLNATDFAFMRAADKYYNDFSGKKLNPVSELLKGYPGFDKKHYYPIHTDPNYTNRDLTGTAALNADGSLVEAGFTHDRDPRATNAVRIGDMNITLANAIDAHAQYVGMAVPVSDMNSLYNARVWKNGKNTGDSMKAAIGRTMGGVNGEKYIENYLQDVQHATPKTKIDEFADKIMSLQGKYGSAVLTNNLSTVMKQHTGFIPSAAYLGVGWQHVFGKRHKTDDILNVYSSVLWRRGQGYLNTETGDLRMKDEGGVPKALDWLTAVDLTTTREVWRLSVAYVEKHHKDLAKGTQTEIMNGESAFYKKVAEVFHETMEATQPSSDAALRSQWARRAGPLSRLLNPFSSQAFLNGNIIQRAWGEWDSARRSGDKNRKKQAVRRLYRTLSSQVIMGVAEGAIGILWQVARGNEEEYQDEKGKVDWGRVAKRLLLGVASNFASVKPFGSLVYEGATALADKALTAAGQDAFFDQKWYGIEISPVEMIEENYNLAQKAVSKTVNLAYEYATGGGENGVIEEFNWKGAIEDAFDAGVTVSELGGIPLNNWLNMLKAGTNMIVRPIIQAAGMPEMAADYLIDRVTENSPDSVYAYLDKAQQAGDEAAYAQIEKIARQLGDIAKDADTAESLEKWQYNEAVKATKESDEYKEMRRNIEAMGRELGAKFGDDIGEKFVKNIWTLETDDEKLMLTVEDMKKYYTTAMENADNLLSALESSAGYKSLTDEQKNTVMADITSYSKAMGRGAVTGEYNEDAERLNDLIEEGKGPVEYLIAGQYASAVTKENSKRADHADTAWDLMQGKQYNAADVGKALKAEGIEISQAGLNYLKGKPESEVKAYFKIDPALRDQYVKEAKALGISLADYQSKKSSESGTIVWSMIKSGEYTTEQLVDLMYQKGFVTYSPDAQDDLTGKLKKQEYADTLKGMQWLKGKNEKEVLAFFSVDRDQRSAYIQKAKDAGMSLSAYVDFRIDFATAEGKKGVDNSEAAAKLAKVASYHLPNNQAWNAYIGANGNASDKIQAIADKGIPFKTYYGLVEYIAEENEKIATGKSGGKYGDNKTLPKEYIAAYIAHQVGKGTKQYYLLLYASGKNLSKDEKAALDKIL